MRAVPGVLRSWGKISEIASGRHLKMEDALGLKIEPLLV